MSFPAGKQMYMGHVYSNRRVKWRTKQMQSDSLLVPRDMNETVSENTSAGFLHEKRILENKLQQNVMKPTFRLQTRHVMRNFRILQIHLTLENLN